MSNVYSKLLHILLIVVFVSSVFIGSNSFVPQQKQLTEIDKEYVVDEKVTLYSELSDHEQKEFRGIFNDNNPDLSELSEYAIIELDNTYYYIEQSLSVSISILIFIFVLMVASVADFNKTLPDKQKNSSLEIVTGLVILLLLVSTFSIVASVYLAGDTVISKQPVIVEDIDTSEVVDVSSMSPGSKSEVYSNVIGGEGRTIENVTYTNMNFFEDRYLASYSYVSTDNELYHIRPATTSDFTFGILIKSIVSLTAILIGLRLYLHGFHEQ